MIIRIATLYDGPQVICRATLWGITHGDGSKEAKFKIAKHQKKKGIFGAEKLESENPKSLVSLDGEELDRLVEFLNMSVGPLKAGAGTYVAVADGDVGQLLKEIAGQIEAADRGELLKAVAAGDFLPEDILDVAILAKRQRAVREFEQHLTEDDWDEKAWQTYFEREPWIFGNTLDVRFLHVLQREALVGGKGFDNKDGQVIDFLMNTGAAQVRFTSLVDIKTPGADLLQPKKYRNRAFPPSDELAGGVSQVQTNCLTWATQGAQDPNNARTLSKMGIYTAEPRAFLVIGHTKELDDDDKAMSFEVYRRGLKNPDIITFDELLKRAQSLAGLAKPPEQPKPKPTAVAVSADEYDPFADE